MDPASDETLDAFHEGRFHLVQPRKGGHRAGMDSLLLAAAVPGGFAGHVADFGAGAGAVGFAVASRCAGATVTLVENSPTMAQFAERTLAHPENAALAGRITLAVADVALAGKARLLSDRSADFVLMNPPFNDAKDRATPDTLRQHAHVASETLFDDWLRSAAATLRPSGRVALIARPASIATIITALAGRFGGVEIIPVHAFADQPAIRILVRAKRGSRAGLSLLPPFIIHETDRSFTPRVLAINAGTASLFSE